MVVSGKCQRKQKQIRLFHLYLQLESHPHSMFFNLGFYSRLPTLTQDQSPRAMKHLGRTMSFEASCSHATNLLSAEPRNPVILKRELWFHQQVSECCASCALSGQTETGCSIIAPKQSERQVWDSRMGIKDCSIDI